ncbi:MAG: hypothetical protein FWE05_11275 [Defluviitaleaceae bacterium]|nr:hypothetical protein [Defluviitaleaceae bacterium]
MTVSNNMLERHRLIRFFDQCKDYPMIAVCAPAGYGKTVAVTQWLNKETRAKAIFSIDEYDNNLAVFCEGFCAALTTCQYQNQRMYEIVSTPLFKVPLMYLPFVLFLPFPVEKKPYWLWMIYTLSMMMQS